MTDIERLIAIEEIKRLKSRYFYCLDYKDWARWKAEVWAPDAKLEVPEANKEVSGVDRIIEWVAQSTAHQTSTHHGHMPDIEILSQSTARGIWAMEDILRRPKDQPSEYGYTMLNGFGHYHETYVRLAAGWRIKSTRLTRLHVEKS
ncbi:MAG TPA: nuclear transport factor 2 family protein [Steroidobacteraceae bacterium]|nr:nuclear transport factor 2 family protein [Steroidobacteraceae bacterium]